VILAFSAAFFFIGIYVIEYKLVDMLSIFFGYFGALYGINEMSRMWSFADSSITNILVFQQLAFFFDFLFSVAMIIPLFIMSGIPFLNIIQTRMMYNKGFSQVVSASSQYAFSLAAFVGVAGGTGIGWLYQVLANLESSPGFISYVATFKLLSGKAGTGSTSYLLYWTAAGGVIVAGFSNFFFGRRLSIIGGGLLSVIGMVVVSAVEKAGEKMLYGGIALLGGSIGILLPSLAIYIYEISTHDMRGKTILLLGCGFILGDLLAAAFGTGTNEIGWVWQVFVATMIISILTPAIYAFPESPYWVYTRQGVEACEQCLTILRRKEGVQDELKAIREEEEAEGATVFKFFLGLFALLVSSLSYGSLNSYMSQLFMSIPDANSMYLNCVTLQFVGALLSFFFIDRVDHRRILWGTLVPIIICAAILGINAQSETWSGESEAIMLRIVGLLIYFFLGLGTTSILWVTIIGLFPPKTRSIYSILYFALFFVVPLFSLYVRVNPKTLKQKEYIYLYALAGCCAILMVLLFGAGTRPNGILCTKEEMKAERARLRRMRASRIARTPGSARSRNLSRSRNKSHSKSNYQLYESPSAAGAATYSGP
jgi:callose synthase